MSDKTSHNTRFFSPPLWHYMMPRNDALWSWFTNQDAMYQYLFGVIFDLCTRVCANDLCFHCMSSVCPAETQGARIYTYEVKQRISKGTNGTNQ